MKRPTTSSTKEEKEQKTKKRKEFLPFQEETKENSQLNSQEQKKAQEKVGLKYLRLIFITLQLLKRRNRSLFHSVNSLRGKKISILLKIIYKGQL